MSWFCLCSVPESCSATGSLIAKQGGIIAGCAVVDKVVAAIDSSVQVHWHIRDGQKVQKHTVLATITGNAHSIMRAERPALNFMMRMSGIATATHALQSAALPATLLDTRKTAPGLRLVDKWAVRLGGGSNHRTGLHDMVLIKENHITASGGTITAVQAACDYLHSHALADSVPVVVEVETLVQLSSLVDHCIASRNANSARFQPLQRVLLDNFKLDELRSAVKQCERAQLQSEASGGISIDNVHQVAQTGVTHISCGSITHSVEALDVSLSLQMQSSSSDGSS